ncbi:MAG: hypothetical protein V3V28_11865 [Polaribacter sp.]|uniref:hypothetical protein n=1 Tax=Polaribacter sp. TaxID=1920175 RepID=UPI002F35268D
MSTLTKIPLLFFLLAFISCADNLDFNQIDDYNATPAITSSLIYFTVLPIQFFDATGTALVFEVIDESEIRVFDNDFVRDKFVKVDFNIEIKNEFDRDFAIQIDLLNGNNTITHRFDELEILANNLTFTNKQTVEVSANLNIKNSTRIRVTIKIENTTTPLDKENTDKFEFKSSATIYFNTDA